MTVFSEDTCLYMGGSFTPGEDYLIYAVRHQGRLMTSFCQRSRSVKHSLMDKLSVEDEMKKLDEIFGAKPLTSQEK